ncbi:PspC domain-containing protein [Litchfieldia alkalitelluris]|uniref:PspC domain-containing protein n=1 Tax=Litchfieldia alkalitelluris TaxID=304268 RepID=UPI0009974C5F|nr:PspC domain-containing protein [Litchfieldia alkalitelluris]
MNRLYRSRSNRKLGGVIGGLAKYFNIDASLLRVLFVLGLIASFGTFFLIYIVWIFVVPNEEDVIK